MSELILDPEKFQKEILDYKGTALVDFWAPWCGPCRMLAPIIEEIEKEYQGKIKIGKMNIDDHNAFATQYHVMSIPTILLFKNGQIVDQIIGMQDKKNITDKIDKLIKFWDNCRGDARNITFALRVIEENQATDPAIRIVNQPVQLL